MAKLKIKKGDTVIVRSGKDKGKKGTVLVAFPADNKVLVEGVNIKKVHERSRQRDQAGKIVERSYPLHAGSVALIDPKDGKPTRVRVSTKDGKRTRTGVRSGQTI